MKRVFRFKTISCVFLLFIFNFSLSNCVTTTLNTIKYSTFSQVKFKNLLIVAPIPNKRLVKQTENAFLTEFNLLGIKVIPGTKLITSVKNYKKPKLLKILKQNNIDGALVIKLQNYQVSKEYIPKSYFSHGYIYSYNRYIYYQGYTQEYGGYYISKPQAEFVIYLLDSKSGKIIWMGISTTRGDTSSNYSTLVRSLAREVAKKFKEENIIKKFEIYKKQ